MVKKDHGVRFDDVCMMSIVKNIMSPNHLAANCEATYVRYMIDDNILIKHKGLLSLLANDGSDAPAASVLDIIDPDNQIFHIPSEEDIHFKIQAADKFV